MEKMPRMDKPILKKKQAFRKTVSIRNREKEREIQKIGKNCCGWRNATHHIASSCILCISTCRTQLASQLASQRQVPDLHPLPLVNGCSILTKGPSGPGAKNAFVVVIGRPLQPIFWFRSSLIMSWVLQTSFSIGHLRSLFRLFSLFLNHFTE